MKKKNLLLLTLIGILTLAGQTLCAQNAPIIIEAEDGSLGADFEVAEDGDIKYISITSTGAGDSPGSAARVASFEVTFPAAQIYDLYIRFRIGSGTFDDDSFFYGNGFGEKSPNMGDEWTRVNNIANIGYAAMGETVGGEGAAGSNVWKWINLSEFYGDEAPLMFEVSEDGLSQTFQIGAREDGLDIDKIAFARSDYFFTVSNLDNGEEGSSMEGPGILPIAHGASKFLGCIYSTSQVINFTQYWNQVTPENAGKWGSVEATRDNMNWTGMDAAYKLAKDNGFPIRFHVLVWGNQQPSWIESLPANEQLEEIKEWFQAVADRYPDLDFVEVVNEALHDPPRGASNGNYIEALGGDGASGWDWILEAFRLARQYFPNAKLAINDYNIINTNTNVTRYLEIINLLKAENLIDQIGFQAHAFSTGGSTSQMRSNLDRLAETGLPLFVTELDIDGPSDQKQLEDYQRVFPIFWEHPAVEGITLWGYRPGLWRTDQKAYLIDTDGVTERPALEWLRSYVAGTITSTHEQKTARHIRVYPNPVSFGEFTVEGMEQLERVELYDFSGKRIWSTVPASNRIRLERSLPSGMYILQLYDERFAYAKKLFIE